MEFEKLERLLHTRHVPPANPFLAERIIANAKYRRRNVSIATWLSALFADFMIPRPAYALAIMLLLGISIGVDTADITTQDDAAISLETSFTDDGATL